MVARQVKKTTIQLEERTKKKLDFFKITPRETYDDVVKKLIAYARDDVAEVVSKGLKDVRSGNVLSTEEVRRKLFGKHGR